MPYIMSAERFGREQGLGEGQVQGQRVALRTVIEARFGPVPEALSHAIERVDPGALAELIRSAATTESLEAFGRLVPPAPGAV